MNRSEQINELAGALSKAQGAFPAIEKNREVTVKSEKGTYKFWYATLDNIVDGIRKPLSENGLSYVQAIVTSDREMLCETMLMHSSGQWLCTALPVKFSDGKNNAQALGSAITYAKRYGLTAMLGIVADEDDDANAADGNHIENSRYKGKPAANEMDAPAAADTRKLSKPQARPEYDKLVKEMEAIQDSNELAQWGALNKARLDAMPDDWRQSLRNEYADRKSALMGRAAQ